MNGARKIHFDRQRVERETALANTAHHLHQMLGHLRAAEHYNVTHGLLLALPNERILVDAISQCARLHQLDKEKTR
jgi:hypothetical protein